MTVTQAFKASSPARRLLFKLSKTLRIQTQIPSTAQNEPTKPSSIHLTKATMKAIFFTILATIAILSHCRCLLGRCPLQQCPGPARQDYEYEAVRV